MRPDHAGPAATGRPELELRHELLRAVDRALGAEAEADRLRAELDAARRAGAAALEAARQGADTARAERDRLARQLAAMRASTTWRLGRSVVVPAARLAPARPAGAPMSAGHPLVSFVVLPPAAGAGVAGDHATGNHADGDLAATIASLTVSGSSDWELLTTAPAAGAAGDPRVRTVDAAGGVAAALAAARGSFVAGLEAGDTVRRAGAGRARGGRA